MRKYLLSSVFCGLCVLGIQAQVTLKGVAVKMNSDFTPVAGVEVVVQGGVPTLTDGAGTFILKLPHMESGDLLFDIRISKQGMEIVNLKEVEQWVASGDILYKVVLCPKGYIEQSRRKFYNIGKSYYQREYERKLQELRVTRELQQADIATFEQEMSQLSQEYDKRMKLLDYYADKFARINKDELSAMERQAMALVEKGDIDGAITSMKHRVLWNNLVTKWRNVIHCNSHCKLPVGSLNSSWSGMKKREAVYLKKKRFSLSRRYNN